MSDFVRVKSKNGPEHEFSVHHSVYEKYKDKYTLIRGLEPSAVAGAPLFREPTKTQPKPPARRRQASKPKPKPDVAEEA